MKSTKLALVLFMVAITATLSAQRQKVNISSFEGINLGIHATMYVTKGSVQSVELEGDDKDLERITVEVNGDVLKIKSKNK